MNTVPKEAVPREWNIDSEVVVDPEMATSYLTESLAGPNSARGTSYTYTYETHYDNPPEDEHQLDNLDGHTQRVTRMTKVTTTRSVRQIPVDSPYGDMYFDASGMPTPSPAFDANDSAALRLNESYERAAPPPAPSLGGRYSMPSEETVPPAPGVPDVVDIGVAEVTLVWSDPPKKGNEPPIIGYQIEMRECPNGEWERAHDELLRETTCTVTNLECLNEVQFRVSAASVNGFGPPSIGSVPIRIPLEYGQLHPTTSQGAPLPPSRPSVVAVDGQRAVIEWSPPVLAEDISPPTGYQIEYRVHGTVDWLAANDNLVEDHRYIVENLRPNGIYEFRIRARNAEGLGAPSRPSPATVIRPAAPQRGTGSRTIDDQIQPPGQPQLVEADIDWVKLMWAESAEPYGYIVEFREVGDPNWYTANRHPITQNCIHVEGLRPGSTYEFRVICVKGNAVSEPSDTSDVVVLRPLWKRNAGKDVPKRPQPPELFEVNGDRITICWLPADSTLPVLGYDVEFRDFQQDVNWYKVNDQPIHACKMMVGDLIDGHDYQFRVLAHNVVGCSEPSEPSESVRIVASRNDDVKYVEAERFGAVRLLQEEMVRESPPLPERDDSPPPLRAGHNGVQWRDPSLKEVIDYLSSSDKEKQLNASGYLQHLTFTDNLIKEETREYGGIPKLINLLKSDSPAIQRNACACLKNLCFGKENDKNKIAILDADGVRMLTALLHTTSDEHVREEATAALWNLSSSDMLKPVILEISTDVLVQQAVRTHKTDGAASRTLFKNSTGVLRNISAASASARKRLRAESQLLDCLVQFLTTAIQRNEVDSQSVENVVCLLRNLSYRIQEVEDPNYDPSTLNVKAVKGSKTSIISPKTKRKDKKKKDTKEDQANLGAALLWQPSVVKLYLKLLQDASNLDALEASAGAIQNLAACDFAPSQEVRGIVRVEKGLPVLVELIQQPEDYLVCAVATALRNLALDQRNRDILGKWALKQIVSKLPDATLPRPHVSDQTIGAVLGILFEIIKNSANYTRDFHELKGTDKLRALAKSYPTYSSRVCKYASQLLYVMWQHKELHDGFKRSGLKDSDFFVGPQKRADSSTLARPISSQGREKPYVQPGSGNGLDDTRSSGGYGAVPHQQQGRNADQPTNSYSQARKPHSHHAEPLYASLKKSSMNNNNKVPEDSWV
ncbi:hypothetical protein WR25_22270 [Diploscapter pachys]|uniref:Fibronectin type-III domain-containing protein n=1 Tax=Diploscapter pachys TaxID=2018661 RepID=A0A2A2L5N8_9BILA|nr:hypothetical protein WR25_22270 [Diploscapter pachys]